MARASSPSFLRALPAKLERSTRTRAVKAWAAHVHHRLLAGRCQPPCQVPTPRPPAFSTALQDARGSVSLRALEGPQAGAVLWEGSTLDELADGFVDHRDGYSDALWGSTPMSTFMRARTSVSVGSVQLACVKDIPTSGRAPIPLF